MALGAALVIFTVTTWRPWELGMQVGPQPKHQLESLKTFSLLWALQVRRTWPAPAVGGKGRFLVGKGTKLLPSSLQDLPIFLS